MTIEPVDLRNLKEAQYEIIAAEAVRALCEIANYEDPEALRESADEAYGLDADEAVAWLTTTYFLPRAARSAPLLSARHFIGSQDRSDSDGIDWRSYDVLPVL